MTVQETVDTSTNEETQETELEQDDTSFEDVDASFEDETDETEGFEDDESANESTEETEEQSEEDEGSQSQDKDVKEERTTSDDEQKRHNDEMARKRIAEREAAKAKQQQDYLDKADNPQDLALRQVQVLAYNNNIQTNVNALSSQMDRAIANIDILTKGTPEQVQAMAEYIDDFGRMYVSRDSNGDPIEVKGDLYNFLQAKADSVKRLTGVGARQESQNKAKQRARTMTPTSRTPKEGKKDVLLDAFEEEANRW